MRRRNDLLHGKQGIGGIDRLRLEDIEAGTGDCASLQRGDQRRFVDDGPSRHVDDERARLHQRELSGTDQMAGAVIKEAGDNDEVRLGQ